jgi:hypothetical protein
VESALREENGVYGSIQAFGNQLLGAPLFCGALVYYVSKIILDYCSTCMEDDEEETEALTGASAVQYGSLNGGAKVKSEAGFFSKNQQIVIVLTVLAAFVAALAYETSDAGKGIYNCLEDAGYSPTAAFLFTAADAIGAGNIGGATVGGLTAGVIAGYNGVKACVEGGCKRAEKPAKKKVSNPNNPFL